jgi:hypothetical protein
MTVRVRNSSDLPITRARLVTSVEVVTSDGFTQELDLGSVDWFDMEPATTRDVPVPAVNETAVELLDQARGGDEYEMRVFMQFTDAAGRSWHRRSNEGHLVDGGTRRERTVAVPPDRWWERFRRPAG